MYNIRMLAASVVAMANQQEKRNETEQTGIP